MNVQIVGTMLDPSGGEPAGGAMIQFIALAQYGGVPKGAQSTQTTSATGEYDFPLNYGRYTLAINHSGRFVNQAVSVTVNEDSPSVMDIDLLLESSVPLTPPEIKYVEELVEQAEQAALSSSNSASQAGAEVINATNQANIATNEADRAKSEADRATQVTGLDTVEQAVDHALGEFAGIMTESEARAINRINEAKYDASGFVNMGRYKDAASTQNSVNEGIWTQEATSNIFQLGTDGVSDKGTSPTPYSMTHIAGAVTNLLGLNYASSPRMYLPEAEDGTRIYDSTGDARGSGQASLDLKVDVDPKYGDVPTGTEAQILREAVGRAFEGGYVRNGDMRDGTNQWVIGGDAGNASMLTSDGKMTITHPTTGSGNWTFVQAYPQVALPDSGDFVLEFYMESDSTPLRVYAFDGTGAYTSHPVTKGKNRIAINRSGGDNSTQAVYFQTSTRTAGTTVFSNFSCYKSTGEVVTHPADLVALEYYEEEQTDPSRIEVMEDIQSLSTTFGTTSVPTVLSTRKLSYFQQYDGQFPEVTANPDFINDRYRCVVWNDLTEPQKREVAAYMGERLFMGVNGFPVNGRLRARSIRGLKNGDWTNIDSTSDNIGLRATGVNSNWGMVRPQGVKDATPVFNDTSSYAFSYVCPQHDFSKDTSVKGVFVPRGTIASYPASVGYQGRCFFYVVATVPRANKGAYHPLNEYGTKKLTSDGSDYKFWYELSEADRPKTVLECFTKARVNTGAINQVSGHPDGIFYDGIEAGGLNGVIDWRLPAVANDSPEEAAKVEAKVENKTYRGLEKLVWTQVAESTANNAANYLGFGVDNPFTNIPLQKNGISDLQDTPTTVTSAGGEVYYVREGYHADGFNSGEFCLRLYKDKSFTIQPTSQEMTALLSKSIVVLTTLNLSVSGEFNTQMVIGDPANILLTDALKDGWLGTWCTVIPDGTGVVGQFPLTRQALGSNTTPAQLTIDNGVTWSTTNLSTDYTKNEVGVIQSANRLLVVPYKAFANQVKKSTNKPVLNATKGLLGVTVTQSHDKAVLAEAVAGVILKSDASGIVTEQSNPVKFLVNEVIERITSLATDMVAPTNGSQAIKIAVYQISENGQVSLGFIANTMTHNGTDWGELDEIIIPFGDLEVDTFNDANGILQTAQSTMTAIPHGWTSNHARAGAQVPGVDL